jgi:N-acetylgalactosamine kinase
MNVREIANYLENRIESRQVFTRVYGDNLEIVESRRKHWLSALLGFARQFGANRGVLLARAPGRANLMGMHIEHQGGSENHVLLSREVIVVAAQNQIGLLRIRNVEDMHADYEVRIDSLVHRRDRLSGKRGWWRYLDGVISSLSMTASQGVFLGADLFVHSDLPEAATLGSSSALSAAIGIALQAVNSLHIEKKEMIEIIARGEKIAGVHGGPGDPAAMLLGQRGHLVHIQYYPMREQLIPFPPNCAVVICHSGKSATKAANARDRFHQQISAYTLARLLIKGFRPELTQRIEHLRDVNPDHLHMSVSEIYSLIKSLPVSVSRAQALLLLPDAEQELDEAFRTHKEPRGGYSVRGVCLYGVTEHARAERCIELLRTEDMITFGELMLIGHDGDRLFRFKEDGSFQTYESDISDEHLKALAHAKPAPDLWSHPGSYRCSTRELDAIVDIAHRVEGVYGARLTGSGLGGCAVVLCKRSVGLDVKAVLQERFYGPRGIECITWIDQPVAGADVIPIPGRE